MPRREHQYLLKFDDLPVPNWIALYYAIITGVNTNEALRAIGLGFEFQAEKKYKEFENPRLWLYQNEKRGNNAGRPRKGEND